MIDSQYIEKRKIGVQTNTQLDNFITNLTSNGTYTFNEDDLRQNMLCLPLHMRNADITMLAGAYKNGVIAGYDSSGNIIDFSYSRIAGNYSPENLGVLGVNEPYITSMLYGSGTHKGYIISNTEIERSFKTSFLDTGINILVRNGIDVSEIGNITRVNPTAFDENHRFNRQNFYVNLNGDYITASCIVRSQNLGVNLYTYVLQNIFVGIPTSTFVGISVNLQTGKLVYKTPHNFYYSIRKLDDDFYFISLRLKKRNTGLDENLTQFSFELTNYHSNIFGNFMGDPTTYLEFKTINVTDNGSSLYYNIDDIEEFSPIANVTAFTITDDSLVFIKTSGGVKEFNVSALDVLDISDYVKNDKLLCFAIKKI